MHFKPVSGSKLSSSQMSVKYTEFKQANVDLTLNTDDSVMKKETLVPKPDTDNEKVVSKKFETPTSKSKNE